MGRGASRLLVVDEALEDEIALKDAEERDHEEQEHAQLDDAVEAAARLEDLADREQVQEGELEE